MVAFISQSHDDVKDQKWELKMIWEATDKEKENSFERLNFSKHLPFQEKC